MKNKRKAVSNSLAIGMITEGEDSSAYDTSPHYRHTTCVSVGGPGGLDGQCSASSAPCDAVSLPTTAGGGLGSHEPAVFLSDARQSCMPVLQPLSGRNEQAGQMVVPCGVEESVDSITCVPAHAITVDGLVSTFTVANTMSPSVRSGPSGMFSGGSLILFVFLYYVSLFTL